MASLLPSLDGRRIVLASASPRRRELLARLGLTFEVVVPEVEETRQPGEGPEAMVLRLASVKATSVASTEPNALVIGADTAIEMEGDVLGKPADAHDAARMLRQLSGRSHVVHTAVAVADRWFVTTGRTRSEVTFTAMSAADIDWYVGTGEPLDKAGAYGLQGIGGAFVESVRGSVTGVLGLPLDTVIDLLQPDRWERT